MGRVMIPISKLFTSSQLRKCTETQGAYNICWEVIYYICQEGKNYNFMSCHQLCLIFFKSISPRVEAQKSWQSGMIYWCTDFTKTWNKYFCDNPRALPTHEIYLRMRMIAKISEGIQSKSQVVMLYSTVDTVHDVIKSRHRSF